MQHITYNNMQDLLSSIEKKNKKPLKKFLLAADFVLFVIDLSA